MTLCHCLLFLISLPFFLQAEESSSVATRSRDILLSSSKKNQALKTSANALYREKKYAQACNIYRQITLSDTTDLRTLNDLALCYENMGYRDSAVQLSRAVLKSAGHSLAGSTESEWSNLDLRARKTAYFNLDKLGGPMREPDSGQCETWASFATCSRPFYVCADVGRRKILNGYQHWAILRIALSKVQAIFPVEEAETQADLPRPEMRDMEAQSISGEYENKLKWVNRDSIVTIPLGERRETQNEDCKVDCQKAETAVSACRILNFDPCSGVIGIACAIDQGSSEDQIVIGEYYLLSSH